MAAKSLVNLRPRLRLSAHEMDLPEGTTTIGRSADCGLTIADTLLSRKHALIEISGQEARVRDLESRNGTFVNEQRIEDYTALRSGDRVRVGSQTLLYVVASTSRERTTEAITPIRSTVRQVLWVDAQLELLARARSLGHPGDIERIVDGLTNHFDALAAMNELDPGLLDKTAREIVNSAVSLGRGSLISWAIDVHRRLGRVPGAATMSALAAVPPILIADADRALTELLAVTTPEQDLFAREMLGELQMRAKR